ncbi:hypothetical protein LCM20_05760 [Halobacillus litoralis]|uniref:hypothetical protein n=1 Tax=Halobacillus litoralis TaxID=45668 RepID=UPI001CD30F3C|nr:hypothetical protein [Halobacillus litoralis]MCA0970083.1 hypothetical protein [Halobacillus litoralis]
MNRVVLYGLTGSLFIFVVFLYFLQHTKEMDVIKYFPLDPMSGFTSFETDLSFEGQSDEDEYEVVWDMYSKSDQTQYLRQDVSLLYVNGRLKGIMNKWEENVQEIQKSSKLHGEDSQKYEAITFHHGEIHRGEEPIRSIQATSHDLLYVIDSPHTKRSSFKKAKNEEEKEWKERLDHSISQQVKAQWQHLFEHYQIPQNKYTAIALTDLAKYNEKPLPNTPEGESDRILGQLWEGLYKNYITGISDTSSKHPIQSYMPVVLFDKNGKHLMVLFEDDTGKKHQLIQYY